MSGINKVILIGRLGKDPEIRSFENGVKKAFFTLATSEIRKDKEGNRTEQTEWHNIVCWRNLAEIAEKYLSKGKLIYLEGKLRTRSWEENGSKRYITEVEVSTFTMLGSKADENTKSVAVQVPAGEIVPESFESEETFVAESSDGLPF
ncbi:MAG: single-stranded DNA-binding protein [Bacteroidales bacterium]|jgi:single-strand DNA-binding protein|nr:single-stranded DNA-binding protein [Bacteroidales bacterium]